MAHPVRPVTQQQLYNARQRYRIKAEVRSHYGTVCQCCGEAHPHFLSMDHIHGKTVEEGPKKLGGDDLLYYLKKNNWPLGFQVLCFNCNCARGFYGQCPHQ